MYAHPQNLAADSISHGSRMLVGPSCRLQQRQRLVASTSRRPLRHMRIAVHADLPNIVVHSPRSRKKNPTEWEHMPLLHARRDRPSQSQRANPDLVRVRHDSFFSMRKKCTISRSHSLGVRARRARAHTWDAAEIASRSLGCVVLLPQESTGEENDRVRL